MIMVQARRQIFLNLGLAMFCSCARPQEPSLLLCTAASEHMVSQGICLVDPSQCMGGSKCYMGDK